MKILKMRASFGKLQGELVLQEGMNVLTLPNEEGKSTWTAFIIAMFYGIDTKERSSQANSGLPAKERYRPWSGKPMEGSIDLEWKGRYITIERKSTAKAPMSIFKAYDTASGKQLGALSAENCGRTLCGVERSVFERTAFIRQMGMSVNADDALERRLGALVSTGEEQGKSAPQLEKELQVLRNRISGRNGRIAKLQTELTEAEQRCTDLDKLWEEMKALEAEKAEIEKEYQAMEEQVQRVDLAKRAQGQLAMEDLGRKLKDQEQMCESLKEMVANLPSDYRLRTMQKKLEEAQNKLETARVEAAFAPPRTDRPQAPDYFEDMTTEQAEEAVKADMQDYVRLSEGKKVKKFWPMFLCFLLLAAAGALTAITYLKIKILPFEVPLPIAVGVAASALTLFLVVWITLGVKSRRRSRSFLQAQQILDKYGVMEIGELPELLQSYTEEQKKYEEIEKEEEEEARLMTLRMEDAQQECENLLLDIRTFAPECTTPAQAKVALAEATEALSTLVTEKRVLENQRAQYANMQKLFGDAPQKVDFEALNMDESKIRYEHRVAGQKLRNVCDRISVLQGRMEATGRPDAMTGRREQLRKQLVEAGDTLRSLELASEVLEIADNRVRSRFSPKITAEAGKILGQLTRGKYPAVQLSADMQLSVREGVLQRPAAAMSCGTADQMYLALRLAMCRMLMPEDSILVLDDALVNFDDDRCDAAIELLSEEARKRQVILFTCRTL